MHDSVAPLSLLLGSWRGSGHGEYPTIRSFDYLDAWEFTHTNKAFIQFSEQTWSGDGYPLHVEMGYLRCVRPGVVEIIGSLPTGQAERGKGTVGLAPLQIETDSTVQNTETAKPVDRIVRRFEVDGDDLHYRMEMAAVGQGLTLHLTSHLRRIR